MDTKRGGWIWGFALFAAAGLAGCDDNDPVGPEDRFSPAIPRGVTSITGDREVFLEWYPNQELDLSGYRIYRSTNQNGSYARIGWVYASDPDAAFEEFVDQDVVNGRTYYYAVSAVDDSGNESDLSLELVYDTPRPEGFDVHLGNYYRSVADCAFVFREHRVTDFDDLDADIAFAYDATTQVAWMWGLDDPDTDLFTLLQDAGWHEDMDGVGWAPPDGWNPQGIVELVEGHVYVAWTRDDHYAKFQVIEVDPQEIVFDWAYQTDRGNQELREEVAIGSVPPPAAPSRAGGIHRRAEAAASR